MKSKLGLITKISTLFLYWKHVELAKIRHFRCETLKPFFSKQAQDSYNHRILAATDTDSSLFLRRNISTDSRPAWDLYQGGDLGPA